jgi:anti-sigma factor RsiW
MSEPSHMTDQERADLVAYLDGELDEEAARALEAKLSLNPDARAEAAALRKTWELLDFLPKPQPSPSFTHRTMERLAPIRATQQLALRRRRRWGLTLGWVAAVLLAGLTGYAGYNYVVPREPGDKELLHDLRIIENKRLYDLAEDLEFWRALDKPDLFGDDPSAS